MHELITLDRIRNHYDRLSWLYRVLWGEHIHHGYWDSQRTAKQAQVALIEQLAECAGISGGAHVLDVGCGLGGSAIWLAQHFQCSTVGITVSETQLRLATLAAKRAGVDDRVCFRLEDANELSVGEKFDVIWVIECSEHLFNKSDFIRRAAAALHPRGVLAVCAWLKSDLAVSTEAANLIHRVCRGMLCPSLGSGPEYCEWMRSAGLTIRSARDITPSVSKTWDLCLHIRESPVVRRILQAADADTAAFVDSFADMALAYRQRAMSYGMFAATKDN